MNRKGKKWGKMFIKRENKKVLPSLPAEPAALCSRHRVSSAPSPSLPPAWPKKKEQKNKNIESSILSIVLGFFLPYSTTLPEFGQMDLKTSPRVRFLLIFFFLI